MPGLLKSISEFGFSDYQPNKNIDRLSIQLRLNGFSFCISNPSARKIHYFNEFKIPEQKSKIQNWQEVTNLFEDWLIQNKWSSDQFNETHISIDSSVFTVLPSSFITNRNLKDQLYFNQNIPYQYVVRKNKILKTDQEILFPIHIGLNVVINEYLPNSMLHHTISILHESTFGNLESKSEEGHIFALVSERNLFLLAYHHKELIFTNSYNYSSKEDFIYFILLVYQTVNLNPEKNQLNLLGDINPSSALYNICYQYIRNITLFNKIENLNLDQDFDSFPIHQYYVQIIQAL